MNNRKKVIMDGNEATAHIAYRVNEVCAIYPITPSSSMGELADSWASEGKKNIWGNVPVISELQSEAGASGSVHGALQGGTLTTTFTASQGLLLMIPNLYKIAGELTSAVIHVSARSIACQALSIFGDHSDVMACRMTGMGMLASSSVQEAHHIALIAQNATLRSRVPFIHFFDGFRTSHELQKIEILNDEDISGMIDDDMVIEHRQRGLSPERPVMRGTAQNPDVFFQGRETVNKFYDKTPEIVQDAMDRFAKITGIQYKLFDYYGAEDAEKLIIIMGSGADMLSEAVDHMTSKGEKVGYINVRLYRPFSVKHFLHAIPESVKSIAVLDRTKEPGSAGEPLYQDVLTALVEGVADGSRMEMPRVIGGRYGLSSKEFTPAMAKSIYEELGKVNKKNHFTIGIKDDVTNTSLDYDPTYITESSDVVSSMFYGLGSDGTVGANKNSIKIIGGGTENYAQGYFVYDSKKSGSKTVSHLRFGPDPIHAPYLIQEADFVGCHQFNFMDSVDVLENIKQGGTFLLNSPYSDEKVWDRLTQEVQERIISKALKFYVIDGYEVAKEAGMGARINTIMQTCFFAISGVLPREEAINKIKEAIEKTYGKKGAEVVAKNFAAVDQSLANLHQVVIPGESHSSRHNPDVVSKKAPAFVQNVTAEIMSGKGDGLPVSRMPVDGTYPTGTTKWEKRDIAMQVPDWDSETCLQCGLCSLVCPHAVIRAKVYDKTLVDNAPEGFKSVDAKPLKVNEGKAFTLQISAEDCTGCGMCVEVCPAKNRQDPSKHAINMVDKLDVIERDRKNWDFFQGLPQKKRQELDLNTTKGLQQAEPYFEFSGACAGCGETPYIKLLTQLFGDRMLVANATGCSSIYGGNLPTTPWSQDASGRGPAWSNSLFEDNAEFGYGFSLATEKRRHMAGELVESLSEDIGSDLAAKILGNVQKDDKSIDEQRVYIGQLKTILKDSSNPKAKHLLSLCDDLVERSLWILGGDGWAYDIGYGGLDHVLASGQNVNVMVLDTEVYSNTGGQMSKSTPRGAVAKFAASGKKGAKKDLALMAMSYGDIYVARIAMGANPSQTIKAIREAEAYDGPSLIIAYSHCIAHGINMTKGLEQQKLAVNCGHWPLTRFNPALAEKGENPFSLDSKKPSIPLKDYAYNEGRYKMLVKSNPEEAARLLVLAQQDVDKRWVRYKGMAENYKSIKS